LRSDEAAMQERLTLTERNRQVHESHDALYVRFLEALTALELDEARALLNEYAVCLEGHLETEERMVMPLFRELHAGLGDTQDPIPTHVEGDHKILRRSLAKAMATMTSLEQGAWLRRDMVHSLESFLLLRRVQEHHDAREQRLVYPVLDQQLDQEQVALLCDALGRP
ncbi:MAG: hypothetical protein ACO3JL_10725, partial [Myxococcota bacterium]